MYYSDMTWVLLAKCKLPVICRKTFMDKKQGPALEFGETTTPPGPVRTGGETGRRLGTGWVGEASRTRGGTRLRGRSRAKTTGRRRTNAAPSPTTTSLPLPPKPQPASPLNLAARPSLRFPPHPKFRVLPPPRLPQWRRRAPPSPPRSPPRTSRWCVRAEFAAG